MAGGSRDPYVGMRPFEPDEGDIFFGRERDAEILTDKVLAARLTVLYAESGLGKSSLLNVLVIPALERNDAVAIYFDAWSQDDPLAVLKAVLVAHASTLNVPDAGSGAPTLTELVRLVAVATHRPVVLVLDQFEELLRLKEERCAPLRDELAALVRASSIDAAVVLSLREEFLAALESFRHAIPDLFHSVFRLEPIAGDAFRRAICEPPRVCGGSCDDALADRLIHDLGAEERTERNDGATSGLGLPILQLVGQELWAHATNHHLDAALYDRLGGTKQIVDRYVKRVMPSRRRARDFTARLMRYLAPPSGKVPYSVEDLAVTTGLKIDRVAHELERLADARILRTRRCKAVTRYELQHDAFVGVIGPWREEQFVQAKWRKRRLSCGAVALGLTVLGAAGAVMRDANLQAQKGAEIQHARASAEIARRAASEELLLHQKEAITRWATGGFLEELQTGRFPNRDLNATARFDFLASSQLWPQNGSPNLDDLRQTLITYQNLLPRNYGARDTAQQPDESSPLEILLAPGDSLDRHAFLAEWRDWSADAAKSRGIPIPTRVRFGTAAGVPAGDLRVAAKEGTPVNVHVPAYAGKAILTAVPTWPVARQFFDRFRSDWKPFAPRPGLSWWLVPTWSLPVWKVAEAQTITSSGFAAFHVIHSLVDDPEPLFSDAAVSFLLARAEKQYPTTVDEARRARGPRLGRDLAALVRNKPTAIVALPEVLDVLAERPDADSARIGREIGALALRGDARELEARNATRVHGPWKDNDASPKPRHNDEGGGATAYAEVERNLPPVEPPIRVYLSEHFLNEWSQDKTFADLFARLDALGDTMYRRTGIELPRVRFRMSEEHLAPNTVRIEFLGELPDSNGSSPTLLERPDTVGSLLSALADRAKDAAPFWISAEAVDSLMTGLPPDVKKWVRENYSLTDLKMLLRELVALDDARRPADGARYAKWLVRSLVFWSRLDGASDVHVLRDRLRTLQERRRLPQPEAPRVDDDIERGVQALIDDDITRAQGRFIIAIRMNKAAAIERFLTEWTRRFPDVWIRDFELGHRDLRSIAVTLPDRIDLDDLSTTIDRARYPAQADRLALYRLAVEVTSKKIPSNATPVGPLAAAFAKTGDLPPSHERWLAQRVYDTYQPGRDDPAVLDAAAALLASAIKRLPASAAREAFADLIEYAASGPATSWAWTLLHTLVDVREPTIEDNLAMELAWSLCYQERPDRVKQALVLADRFDALVQASDLPASQRLIHAENGRYVRAVAFLALARSGEPRWDEAERLLRQLSSSRREGIAREAYLKLASLEYERRRFESFDVVIADARRRWPTDVGILAKDLWAQLHRQRIEPAARVVRDLVATPAPASRSDDPPEWLFVATVGGMMAASDGWQGHAERLLKTPHHYRDYVVMLYRAFASGPDAARARAVVEARWAEIQKGRDRWQRRLREGDMSAWREILLARFAGDGEADDLLNALEDDTAWTRSPLQSLPVPRDGLRTEAWFYKALRTRAAGSTEKTSDALRRCASIGYASYIEYTLATFLLGQEVRNSR